MVIKGNILHDGGDLLEQTPKKKDKREYTLMIVPHNGQKVRTIHIPIIAVKYMISLLCFIIVLMAGSFVEYRHTRNIAGTQQAELEVYRQDNGDQVNKIEQLAKEAAVLQADMERLNSLDAEIRLIIKNDDGQSPSRAGLVRPTVAYKGQGGPVLQPNINNIKDLVDELQSTTKVREQSLLELKEELLAKKARMEATPSIWPAGGDVTSRFGWRSGPFGGGSDYHPGIDIANSSGTVIVATASGEVIQSEWNGGYGNMIQIDHGNVITTIYGHNSQIIVHVGQMVKKGQAIAYMGSTGYSTGPHVHYEVRVNGTATNPASFLK